MPCTHRQNVAGQQNHLPNGPKLTYHKDYDGRLSIAVDAWSSPNHKALLAITIHLLHDEKPLRMVLDVIELAKAHTGKNMAKAIADTLKEFGIAKKVCLRL